MGCLSFCITSTIDSPLPSPFAIHHLLLHTIWLAQGNAISFSTFLFIIIFICLKRGGVLSPASPFGALAPPIRVPLWGLGKTKPKLQTLVDSVTTSYKCRQRESSPLGVDVPRMVVFYRLTCKWNLKEISNCFIHNHMFWFEERAPIRMPPLVLPCYSSSTHIGSQQSNAMFRKWSVCSFAGKKSTASSLLS